MTPPLITLEEHYLSEHLFQTMDNALGEQLKWLPDVGDKLRDIDSGRLADMDKNQVSIQVISSIAAKFGGPSLEESKATNDQLAQAVQKHPNRFAGFACLPVADPEASTRELHRCVKDLGFVGALIDNHSNGTFFDGAAYDCLWAKAVELDVPIYLHPTWPADTMLPQYTGNFTPGASKSLGASGWGWHSETGLHVLRLFAAGVFDKFPALKIIIGHFGELLPFQLQRVCNLSIRWGKFDRPLKQVWDENIWITTSGVWSLDPLKCILGNTKMDRILYSVDYPLEKNENGLKWMEELERSGLVSDDQLEMIAYKNAETLLKIKLKR